MLFSQQLRSTTLDSLIAVAIVIANALPLVVFAAL